jgi:hypothetical protein
MFVLGRKDRDKDNTKNKTHKKICECMVLTRKRMLSTRK